MHFHKYKGYGYLHPADMDGTGRLLTPFVVSVALFSPSGAASRSLPLVSCHVLEDDHLLCADFEVLQGSLSGVSSHCLAEVTSHSVALACVSVNVLSCSRSR